MLAAGASEVAGVRSQMTDSGSCCKMYLTMCAFSVHRCLVSRKYPTVIEMARRIKMPRNEKMQYQTEEHCWAAIA